MSQIWIPMLYVIAITGMQPGASSAQTGAVQHVHDPAIIKHRDSYFIFSTGKGIPIRRSKDLLKWELIGEIFEELPRWARLTVPGAKDLWAPDISFFNGKYHLYYAVSTFGKNGSCIGLAVNKTLDPSSRDYAWLDQGKVIESRPGRDDWNAIDPNIVFDENHHPWLAFGSFWSGIKLRRIDAGTGRLSHQDTTLYPLAARPVERAVEAPFLIRHQGYYYLFVSFDFCCRGADSNYKILVGRSTRLTGPYVDRAGKPMLDGGGTLVLAGYGRIRGPGHNAVLSEGSTDWLVHHYYDAGHKGVPTLQIRPLLWAHDGWPLPGEPYVQQASQAVGKAKVEMAGVWEHSVGFDPGKKVQFHANGRLGTIDGPATWSLHGASLTLRWPQPQVPGDVLIDQCLVSPDGKWYVGRNQQGLIIRGRRAKKE